MSKKIDNYIEGLSTGAQHPMRRAIGSFFDYVKKDPENYFIEDYEMLETTDPVKALKYRRAIEENVVSWVKSMIKSNKLKVSSIKQYYGNLKRLLEKFDINIKSSLHDDILKLIGRENKDVYDKPLKFDELQQILYCTSSKRYRAFYSICATSGIRPIELIKTELKNIDFDSTPTKIKIPGVIAKNGRSRITFITPEATEILKEYLEVREDDFERARKERYRVLRKEDKAKGVSVPPYNKELLFGGMAEITFYRYWSNLLEKSGFNQKHDNNYIYHFYVLRKTFATVFSGSNLDNIDFKTQQLLGHQTSVTTQSYVNFDEDTLKEVYLANMHRLYIFRARTSEEQDETIEALKKQHKKQMQQVDEKFNEMNIKLEMFQSDWWEKQRQPQPIQLIQVPVDVERPELGFNEEILIKGPAPSNEELYKQWQQLKEMQKYVDEYGLKEGMNIYRIALRKKFLDKKKQGN